MRFQSRLLPIPPTSDLSPSRTDPEGIRSGSFHENDSGCVLRHDSRNKEMKFEAFPMSIIDRLGLSDRNRVRVIINHLGNILIQLRSYLYLSLLLYVLLSN